MNQTVQMDQIEQHKEKILEIAKMIIDLNSFLNVSKKMDIDQMTETARLIKKYHPKITLPELDECLEEIKAGRVNLYNAIDGTKIIAVIDRYIKVKTKPQTKHLTNAEPMNVNQQMLAICKMWREQHPESFQRLKIAIQESIAEHIIQNL